MMLGVLIEGWEDYSSWELTSDIRAALPYRKEMPPCLKYEVLHKV